MELCSWIYYTLLDNSPGSSLLHDSGPFLHNHGQPTYFSKSSKLLDKKQQWSHYTGCSQIESSNSTSTKKSTDSVSKGRTPSPISHHLFNWISPIRLPASDSDLPAPQEQQNAECYLMNQWLLHEHPP